MEEDGQHRGITTRGNLFLGKEKRKNEENFLRFFFQFKTEEEKMLLMSGVRPTV